MGNEYLQIINNQVYVVVKRENDTINYQFMATTVHTDRDNFNVPCVGWITARLIYLTM